MKPDSAEFMMSAIEYMAQEYRYRNRLVDGEPIEVHVPDWYAQRLVERYGSLRTAADTVFIPGRVTIVNQYWHDRQVEARENVERKLTQPSACSLDDLTRIAFGDAHTALPIVEALANEKICIQVPCPTFGI